jgi:hypothetical protein
MHWFKPAASDVSSLEQRADKSCTGGPSSLMGSAGASVDVSSVIVVALVPALAALIVAVVSFVETVVPCDPSETYVPETVAFSPPTTATEELPALPASSFLNTKQSAYSSQANSFPT